MARLSQPKYCLNEVEDYGIEAESGNPWQFLAIRGNPWYIPCQSVVRQVCAQFSSVWFYTCSLKAGGDALTDYSIDGSDTADSFSYAFVCIISRGNGSNHSFYHRGEGKFGSFWSVS